MFSFISAIFTKIAAIVTSIFISTAPIATTTQQVVIETAHNEPQPKVLNILTPKTSAPIPSKYESKVEEVAKQIKTFVTPSGAVVDENGNIVSQPKPVLIEIPNPVVSIPTKEIKIITSDCDDGNGHWKSCEVAVTYLENSEGKDAAITIYADVGYFQTPINSNITCSGGEVIDINGTRKGTALTCNAQPTFVFTYFPSVNGLTRSITTTANGVSATKKLEVRAVDKIFIEVSDASGNILQADSSTHFYSFELNKEYYFKIVVYDNKGARFNNILVEIVDPNGTKTMAYTNTVKNYDLGDWYAFFSYTPRVNTGRSEGIRFTLPNRGWATGIDYVIK